jgi:asparagine synthase (glutamine-hydrolysing)
MCGIAGFLGAGPDAERLARLERMTAAIAHRGPDDDGHFIGPGVALGMRRLSIIDLAGGHQPMWRDDGLGIVFNGEIYNFKVLREQLEEDGYVFRTRSDTEVVLHLYHRDGLEGLRRLEGMFAFALLDPRSGTLHLVRDRIGVKPLYVAEAEGRLLFGSEIKAILAGLDRRPELDRSSLNHFLTLRYVPAPRTIWRGVTKVLPGTVLSVDLRALGRRERRWWSVRFESQEEDPGRDYLKEFEALFLAAVDKRLLAADVPVGVLLSGGLDSSAVSMAAADRGHRDLHTFSVAFEDGGIYDETPYARQVAERFGTRHHEVRIGRREMIDFLPELVYFSDEPLADLASVPLYFVSRLARQHVKAVLSGEGSDEIFAGYDLEQVSARLERLRTLDRVIPGPVLRLAGSLLPDGPGAALRTLGATGLQGYVQERATHVASEWSEAEKRALWREDPGGEPTGSVIRSWYAASPSPHPLDQIQDVMIGNWLVEDLLMKADKMSMATSLELREPFLDHHLVEWAARLPVAWKVGDRKRGASSKRILREWCRGRLPEPILTREKRGFPVPAYEWMSGDVLEWARGLVRDPRSRIASLFHTAPVDAVLERAKTGDQGAARRVWTLVVAEHWLRRWT